MRHEEVLKPDAIADLVAASFDKYGLRDFQLKGGTMRPEKESGGGGGDQGALPNARATRDPNAALTRDEAITACKGKGDILANGEDPCAPEKGCSGGEIMAEFKRAAGRCRARL